MASAPRILTPLERMQRECVADPLSDGCIVLASSNDPSIVAAHRLYVGQYCNDHGIESNQRCKDMCLKYRGSCNMAATTYCARQATQDDKFCSCLKFNANHPGTPGVSECIDNDCYMLGYKTTPTIPTCDQTICSVYWDLRDAGGNVNLRDNTIVQNCGSDDANGGATTSGVGSIDSRKSWEMETEQTDRRYIMILSIAAAAVMAMILFRYYSTRNA